MSTARPTVVFSAYFSGTGHHISNPQMLACNLYERDEGTPIGEAGEGDTHIKQGFDGNGITHGGFLGGIYGEGVNEQAAEVANNVRALIAKGKKVVLNAYGHSRGGVTALLLAKKLGQVPQDLLEINLALHDPVPGNFTTVAKLDAFNLTLAEQAVDLSACKNIKKVLALYPAEPLLSIIAHAPIFPKYPKNCQVKQDAIPGCHAGAQQQSYGWSRDWYFDARSLDEEGFAEMAGSFISFVRFKRFLMKCGTSLSYPESVTIRFRGGHSEITRQAKEPYKDDLFLVYHACHWRLNTAVTRSTHSHQKTTIRSAACSKAEYINLQHKKLFEQKNRNPEYKKNTNPTQTEVALTIVPNTSHRVISDQVDYASDGVRDLFRNLINEISNSLSSQSRLRKGVCLEKYINELQEDNFKFESQLAVINALRNVIALVLQRDRYQYSMFTTTRSGEALLKLLKNKKYPIFAHLILGSSGNKLRYRDLRSFVVGENNRDYFNAKHRKNAYDIHQESKSIKADQNYFNRSRINKSR